MNRQSGDSLRDRIAAAIVAAVEDQVDIVTLSPDEAPYGLRPETVDGYIKLDISDARIANYDKDTNTKR